MSSTTPVNPQVPGRRFYSRSARRSFVSVPYIASALPFALSLFMQGNLPAPQPILSSSPRPYEPRQGRRNDHWQPGEVLPSRGSSVSSQLTASHSFAIDDEDLQCDPSDTEKLWADVQSLIKMNFDNLESKFRDMSQRMEQMDDKLSGLQTIVEEQLSESPSSSDSSRNSVSSRKRKRKTPVTLQV